MLTPEQQTRFDSIRKMNSNRSIEGYWYSKHNNSDSNQIYPMPIPNVLTEEQAVEIYNLILEKESNASEVRYRGFSESRIDDSMLGCVEYQTDEWLWPGDFAPHYVLKYKVKPSDEFLNYIGYKF